MSLALVILLAFSAVTETKAQELFQCPRGEQWNSNFARLSHSDNFLLGGIKPANFVANHTRAVNFWPHRERDLVIQFEEEFYCRWEEEKEEEEKKKKRRRKRRRRRKEQHQHSLPIVEYSFGRKSE
jgi:hypothetical protein